MEEDVPIPEYQCLICQIPYREPRKLSCGHTFCCRCLKSYIEAEHVKAEEENYFPCPVCNAPNAPGEVGNDVSTWAECFPINNLYLNPTTEASDVHLCAPCQRGEESNPADVWCTDCEERLCKQCRSYHQRNKASADHGLVSLSKIIAGLCSVKVNENCPKHHGKSLDVFCVDHSDMCCSVCVSVSHRLCNNVIPIEDVIRKTMTEQQNDEKEWREIRDEAKKMLNDDYLGMTLLTSNEKEVMAEMTNRIQQVKNKLDNLNETFQTEIAYKCKVPRKHLSTRRMCINKFHTNAENSRLLMSDLDKQISTRQRFIIREQTKNQISGHYRRMDQITKKQPNRFDITFKLDKILDDIMKLKTLGNVDVTSTISEESQNANVCLGNAIEILLSTPPTSVLADTRTASQSSLQNWAIQTTAAKAKVDVWTGSISCIKALDSGTLGGSSIPWLMGGIFTDNNELLMTDYSNRRLLMFDDTYSYLKEITIDGQPTDIVRGLAADEVFVAVKDRILKGKLQNGQLSVNNTIISPRRTYGIAVLGDNILVSTPVSVDVITFDGEVTKTIQTGGEYRYLATSRSNTTVYHKDDDDVVCRRVDNDAEVYRYKNPDLKTPRGIGLDQGDNLYVCGFFSRNVYLVSPDGSHGRVLVSKLSGINTPWCVVVHPTRQEFVVTSFRESTSLEIYRVNKK